MNYDELEALVIQWADEKGILEKGTPGKQAMKTLEECGELIHAVASDNREEITDSLGDVLVTIIIQAKMQNLSLVECLHSAYLVISQRTGVMKNGQFVKNG